MDETRGEPTGGSGATLADRVYREVRGRLLEGEVPQDRFFREQGLSEEIGVSRTPVREALARLASEGFLERIPHRGFRVPDESLSRLLELYPIVAALEVLAGRLAFPGLDAGDLEELRRINGRLREAVEAGDVAAAVDRNDRFHALIAERSGNERLGRLLEDLRAQLRRLETWYYSDPSHGERSVREHRELVDALAEGRRDRALEILEGNMRLTRRELLRELGRADDRD